MTRIPREYTAQDHLNMAEHFDFNVSTNPDVVAGRRERRGRHANIIEDQSAGLAVGTRTLELLDDKELQAVWAKLYGGTMLNSALYLLRGSNDQPMSRHFKLPRLVSDGGELLDDDARRSGTLYSLGVVKDKSQAYEQIAEKSKPTSREASKIGHRLGNTSMLVGIFSSDYKDIEDEHAIMAQVLEQETQMHEAVKELAQRLGVNPSVAQLRSDNTRLGADIVHSKLPLEIKTAFHTAVDEINDGQGY